jgi:hypothetical protein
VIAWAIYLIGALTVVCVSWDDEINPIFEEHQRRLAPLLALAWPVCSLGIIIYCCLKGRRRG